MKLTMVNETHDFTEYLVILQGLLDQHGISDEFVEQLHLMAAEIAYKFGYQVGKETCGNIVTKIHPWIRFMDESHISWKGIKLIMGDLHMLIDFDSVGVA